MLQQVRAFEDMPSWTVQNCTPNPTNEIFHTTRKNLKNVLSRTKQPSAFESKLFLALEPTRQQTLTDIFNAVAERSNHEIAEAWLQQQLKNPNQFAMPWTMQRKGVPATFEKSNNTFKRPQKRQRAYQHETSTKQKEEILTHAQRAEKITSRVENLKIKERNIYQTLVETALVIAEARDYSPHTTHVTFFCPGEIVAHALDMHRTTLWKHLKTLEQLGLVDNREYKTTVNGKNINAGKLWQLKLNPNEGSPAKVHFDDFKHTWRDLAADIKSGKTAYNALHPTTQQSKELLEGKTAVNQILTFALPNEVSFPSSSMTVAENIPVRPAKNLECILDIRTTPKLERNHMVDASAKAIATILQDTGEISLKFYRKCLWNLLRQYDQGKDYFPTFYELASRAKHDVKEGFARSGGALFVMMLEDWPAWDEIRRTPRTKVGSKDFRRAKSAFRLN
jgi:hypothetical protein